MENFILPRKKPEKIIPIETSTFINDDNEEITIEIYDDNKPPNGRGDNNRFLTKSKVSLVTDKIIDELLKRRDPSFLDKPSAFRTKCEVLGLTPHYEGDSKDPYSSYRRNIYEQVKQELEILFNAINNQPKNERNQLGSLFYSAYSKYKIEKDTE